MSRPGASIGDAIGDATYAESYSRVCALFAQLGIDEDWRVDVVVRMVEAGRVAVWGPPDPAGRFDGPCAHRNTYTSGGNYTYTETCSDCGASRDGYGFSPWTGGRS